MVIGDPGFPEWLEGQFGERDWTLGQAEIQTGVGKSQLSLYVRGKAIPNLRTIRKLAKALGVTTEAIEQRLGQERRSNGAGDRTTS